jgi:YD repeat-containing protein
MRAILSAVGLAFAMVNSAQATEAAIYRYDARGRLVEVKQSGGPADGATTTYSHDGADNRTNVTVVAKVRAVVVPLNGFTVIPLN